MTFKNFLKIVQILSIVSATNAFAEIETKLTASDAAANDEFGGAVSIDGDYAIVGAEEDDDSGDGSGSAYIFFNDGATWTQQAKLTASDAAIDDKFGYSVAISGDYAIVGARLDDDAGTSSGSAYIFFRSGTSWTQQAKLTASDAAESDQFGVSVAIDGDYAIVGANRNDDVGSNSGSAYIFNRSGTSWTQQAKITASDAAANDFFGLPVAISGDYAIISAYLDDDDGSSSGSTYIFNRSGTSWTQQAKLTANDAAANDQFGRSVAISGDYAVIGAYLDDDDGANSGSAYIFNRSGTTWTQQDKITASDAATQDFFGFSAAIRNDKIIIGAYQNDDAGSNSGSAYIFNRDGSSWTQKSKITANDAALNDNFGYSVGIDGNFAIVGAFQNDSSGSAYLFTGSDIGLGVILKEVDIKVTANDAATGDEFAKTVSIDGNYAIVGARFDDDGGNNSGSAYIYFLNGSSWTQQAKLTANDAAADDLFGGAVSINGDYAIVGAESNDDDGSAYIYKRTGTSWAQEAKLKASNGNFFDFFGWSVDIDGDYAVVGAFQNDANGNESGSAYIFNRTGTNWTQQAILTPNDPEVGDQFGYSVAISGEYAVVGAYASDDNGSASGSAYVFKRTGTSWAQEAKLLASNPNQSDQFGWSSDIDGDYIIISAPLDSFGSTFRGGSAYIFERNGSTWTEQVRINASDPNHNDNFGISVSINGTVCIAGSPNDDDNGASNSGSGYIFTRSGDSWIEQAKLTASDAESSDNFGNSVSINSNSNAIVGAFGNDDNGSSSGSAYFTSAGDVGLPVELTSFYSESTSEGINILWETESETNNLGFKIRRAESLDGEFSIVASYVKDTELRGQINSSFPTNYKWLDKDVINGKKYFYYLSDVDLNGKETHHKDKIVSEVAKIEETHSIVNEFVLLQNYPNPFNPKTTIAFALKEDSNVKLQIFNEKGEFVRELLNDFRVSGSHSIVWDGNDNSGKQVSSGVYFYRINTGGIFNKSKKMILLK